MSSIHGQDAFSRCHPLNNLLYFALVLLFSMWLMHPACLITSLACALLYAGRLRGGRALGAGLRLVLPVALMAAVLNPAFSHEGITILAYFPSGNPLTLESILYGLGAAAMLAAVITWFSCYTAVMTSDKFVYLFGRVIPSLSLVLSMTLRFVPRFTGQLQAVRRAQRCVGRDLSQGSARRRLKNAVTMLSILVTWTLENAIGTADSMKSRGYGLPGRTAFSIYTFDSRDRLLLAWLCFCGFFVLAGALAGGLDWRYYPSLRAAPATPLGVCFHLAYLALCLTPIILDRREEQLWNRPSPRR